MDPQQQPANAPLPTQPTSPQQPLPPTEPAQNAKRGPVIAVIVVLLIGGVAAFALWGGNKNDGSKNNVSSNPSPTTNATNPSSSKFSKFEVTDKPTGTMFAISFYKDAKVEEKSGRTFLNSGEVGSMYSVFLVAATGNKIDCSGSPTSTMRLGGVPTTVCYKADHTQYAGYAKTKSGTIKLNLAGQKAISMDDAKAIMESATFN